MATPSVAIVWSRHAPHLPERMAVAYFQLRFPHGFGPVTNGGIPAALYSFGWL